jgi:hypothetical protein
MKRLLLFTVLAFSIGTIPSFAQGKPADKNRVLKNVSVTVIPGSLAKTIHVKVIPRAANNHDEPPFMNGEPEHFRVQFDNDTLSDYSNFGERQLLVYPLAHYGALFKGKEKTAFDKDIAQLQAVIAKKSDGGMKHLPILPAVESSQVFHSHVKHLLFKKGKGVAFLSCYAQDDTPINNGDFFYTYQGLSDDGKYYVSLFVPVQAKSLPKDMPSKKATTFLNNLPSNGFTPNLDEIDKMIQTISIK